MRKRYKIIKEFPTSPPIGTIFTEESGYYSSVGFRKYYKEDVENNPEFFEKFEGNYSAINYDGDLISGVVRASDVKTFKIGDYITFNGMHGQKWETSKSQITGFGYRYIGNNPTGKIGIYYGSGFVDIDKLVGPKIKEGFTLVEAKSMPYKIGFSDETVEKIINNG